MSRSFGQAPIDFRSMPPAVKWLLVVNAAVFALRAVVNGGVHAGPFDSLFGLVPQRFLFERWVWQAVTYLFIHNGFFHLLFNLFCIWMFGMPVEAQWGAKEFLKFYLVCGLGAAAASLALSPTSAVPVVGASGAVFGLLVAFAMLYPDAVVYLYFFLPVTARQMAIICGVIELFSAAAESGSGVARFAHLGGLATGYLYIRWWWLLKIRAKAWFKGAASRPPAAAARRGARASGAGPGRGPSEPPAASMDDVDRVLDKILACGIDSLSDEEKAVMRRYSERNKH
ncbi:MAG: rhomboid family intramembrane serine protease [Elusimicrobia bacterium]|nr:rhomboid family intramembrane serine protease [Elusimicrobiota bacterium]